MIRLVYLSGPIAGNPGFRASFAVAARALAEPGVVVIDPCDVPPAAHPGPCPPGYPPGADEDAHGHTSSACFMRADLAALLACDAIHMLPGWERSRGARVELAVAEACGMTVTYAEEPR